MAGEGRGGGSWTKFEKEELTNIGVLYQKKVYEPSANYDSFSVTFMIFAAKQLNVQCYNDNSWKYCDYYHPP